MSIISCRAIEKPILSFYCLVQRPPSSMHYQESTGEWKPVAPERIENWTIMAETLNGAKKIAEYHFYNSKIIDIK